MAAKKLTADSTMGIGFYRAEMSVMVPVRNMTGTGKTGGLRKSDRPRCVKAC
jgi:hypothetical protein